MFGSRDVGSTAPNVWVDERRSSVRSAPVAAGDPGGDLGTRGEAELGQDVLHVVLRGAFGDMYGRRDLPVGEPF
jgi:hypothetical protein